MSSLRSLSRTKRKNNVVAWSALAFAVCCTAACKVDPESPKDGESSAGERPYFGQDPPGSAPRIFAPGVVSIDGRFEGTVSFSPDLTEMYFAADDAEQKTAIYFSRREGDGWTPIERISLTKGEKEEEMHPFFSPVAERIYFTAMDSAFTDEKIWYADRLGNAWGDAAQLDSPVNEDLVFFANQSGNGDLYYFNLSKFKTYRAPARDGEFPEVEEVAIDFGHHAFVSPAQDYLIATERSDQEAEREDNDMYVYFRQDGGAWSEPINLGPGVNTVLNEKGPRISPDGRYLFFGRDERDVEPGLANIFWVSTEVVEDLRPSE